VAERLLATARDMLRHQDQATVNLGLALLVEMAEETRAKPDGTGLSRALTLDVIALVKNGAARLRLPAAKALGLMDADPVAATPVLGELLRAPDPALRRAAAEGLDHLLQSALESADPVGRVPRSSEARREAVMLANTILSALATGHDDGQAEIRRRCTAATRRTITILYELLTEAPQAVGGDVARRAPLEGERADLRPLLLGVRDQLPNLAAALRDEDVDVRLTALGVLEGLARVRARWVRQGVWLDGPARSDDPLGDGMQTALPALARALTDGEVRVRRVALDALEAFGSAAAPAAPAVAGALTDADRFVRWSAVRALQAIGAPAALPAVPALARVLDDVDVDVARAALDALVRLDPTGKGVPPRGKHVPKNAPNRSAVPALARAVKAHDTGFRLAAIRALQGMGDNARPAVPALSGALGDQDVRVRQAAAAALGELGTVARDAVPDLNLALKDPDDAVRRAASDALLRITRGGQP
jgi:HEAT repeat protein